MDVMALFSSNISNNYIIGKLLIIPGLIFFFSFRGYFQAWTAKKLGDNLPASMGFLTMNPLAHIDIIGFICMILVGFGFGKPIQFDSRNYKNIKRDGAIQILSAPLAGLIVAFVMYFFYEVCLLIGYYSNLFSNDTFNILLLIFYLAFHLSISLTIFLFLPLPGFDSYRLIANFLPYRHYRKLYTIEKYSLFIFLGFIFLLQAPGIGDALSLYLIDIPTGYLASIISAPWRFLFGLFV